MDIESLKAEIARHRKLYWEDNSPQISDQGYDSLVRRLAELSESCEPVAAPKVASSGKVRHARPMLSLDKAYSYAELKKWMLSVARSGNELFWIEPKYDGVSAKWDGEVLSTRGDGRLGEDISSKLPLIYGCPEGREAYGELVIMLPRFARLNGKAAALRRKDGSPYKNTRNAVAGILGLVETPALGPGEERPLSFMEYGASCRKRATMSELSEPAWLEIKADVLRESSDWPLDGVVVKLADQEYSESLGATEHHPRGCMAFKFGNESAIGALKAVDWQFGGGKLTPVARLQEPVEIGGASISNATLHNAKRVLELKLKAGSSLVIERAGGIIPVVSCAIPPPCGGEDVKIPEKCPSCGHALSFDGVELRCFGDCRETRIARLCLAIEGLGIEGLGEPTVRKLWDGLGVRDIKDVLCLEASDIERLPGFGQASALALRSRIDAALNPYGWQLLLSLVVPGIGASMAKRISARFSIGEILSLARKSELERLASAIEGVGESRAAALQLGVLMNADLLGWMLRHLEVREESESGARRAVCFTGKMPEPRKHYERCAKERGFNVSDDVSSSTWALVADDPNADGNKLKKARRLGVRIISLDDWLGLDRMS